MPMNLFTVKKAEKAPDQKEWKLSTTPWEEAIDFAAKNLKGIRDQYGSDALAFLSCAGPPRKAPPLFIP